MDNITDIPGDLRHLVDFHGHLCPGLVYGFRAASEAARLLGISRARDEEIVAICENDSCAVDAFQVILGATAGKGNLIIKNYGKNAYTVMSRHARKSLRFSRVAAYRYQGDSPEEFERLEAAFARDTLTREQRQRHRMLKVRDLLRQDFSLIFSTEEKPFSPPPFAEIAPSIPCALCGEMTMSVRMTAGDDGRLICLPCRAPETEGPVAPLSPV